MRIADVSADRPHFVKVPHARVAKSTRTNRPEPECDEELVVDARAHLSPAQFVERKLMTLLADRQSFSQMRVMTLRGSALGSQRKGA